MMKGYFETVTGNIKEGLTLNDFDKIITIDTTIKRSLAGGERGGKIEMAKTTGRKVSKTLKEKGMANAAISRDKLDFSDAISNFQTQSEIREKEICLRNFKRFLFTYANLPPYEAENLVMVLDKGKSGFLKVPEILNYLR